MISGNNSTLKSTYIPNIIYTLYNIICLRNSYSIISHFIYACMNVYTHV